MLLTSKAVAVVLGMVACSSGIVIPGLLMAYTLVELLIFFKPNFPTKIAFKVGWFLMSSYTFPDIYTPPGTHKDSTREAILTPSPKISSSLKVTSPV